MQTYGQDWKVINGYALRYPSFVIHTLILTFALNYDSPLILTHPPSRSIGFYNFYLQQSLNLFVPFSSLIFLKQGLLLGPPHKYLPRSVIVALWMSFIFKGGKSCSCRQNTCFPLVRLSRSSKLWGLMSY